MLNEFDIIKNYFNQQTVSRADVLLGIGDDAAILNTSVNESLVIAVDTLVEGVHFPRETTPYDIGYKALAVNLSDLAAMGAKPCWMTLALTMPDRRKKWLKYFAQGLFDLASQYHVQLVGGDTTKGPLTITIQIMGSVPPHQALKRQGAKIGDRIYVSGTLGDAGLGLKFALSKKIFTPTPSEAFLLQRLNRPTPRIELGLLLRNFATSAIDISDGLIADLSHILTASKVGAKLFAKQIPLSDALQALPWEEAIKFALSAGDDYELCFTVPLDKELDFLQASRSADIRCSLIGQIEKETKLEIVDFDQTIEFTGYKHF